MEKQKIIIIGAAGRDFHNFNVFYRDNPNYQVVAFTASQIPDIDDRKYPKELAGDLYPDGIPIYTQEKLPDLIKEFDVDECVFAYSDVNYHDVMALSAKVNSAGADFKLMGPKHTSLKSKKPVISVCAVRTGSGKSQSSRKVIEHLLDLGLKVVAIRHPMPYGDLVAQKVQRYADLADLDKYDCTIEEMEEYEPHIDRGNIIYSGVDYQAILDASENDPDGCDLILWDGGNNDFSFIDADLAITIADPHRPGHEISYYPGQVSLEMADLAVINKVDSAKSEDIQTVEDNIKTVNPQAQIIKAESTISVDDPDLIKDKKVLIVEDGPTLTHGEMKFGAGTVAAQRFEASQIIDPRPYLAGSLKDTFEKYPDIGQLLPAMGYGHQQLKDLEETINQTDCDTVIIGTPIDLSRVININKPHTRIHYELNEVGGQTINQVLDQFVAQEVKQ